MRVILLSDVRGSGKKGDVVNVADGYAKNYLIKNKLAKEATNSSLNELKNAQESKKYHDNLNKEHAIKIKEQLNEKTIKIFRKAGKNGKLFSAVTSHDIADKIKEVFKIEIDKRKISLNIEDNVIKHFGAVKFDIKVFLFFVATMLVIVCDEKEKN